MARLPEEGDRSPSRSGTPRSTTARLLVALTTMDEAALPSLAAQMRIDAAILTRCRDEGERLDPVLQMTLAALALSMAPDLKSLAHRVYGQAQTALRLENGSVESHMIYPKRPFT